MASTFVFVDFMFGSWWQANEEHEYIKTQPSTAGSLLKLLCASLLLLHDPGHNPHILHDPGHFLLITDISTTFVGSWTFAYMFSFPRHSTYTQHDPGHFPHFWNDPGHSPHIQYMIIDISSIFFYDPRHFHCPLSDHRHFYYIFYDPEHFP